MPTKAELNYVQSTRNCEHSNLSFLAVLTHLIIVRRSFNLKTTRSSFNWFIWLELTGCLHLCIIIIVEGLLRWTVHHYGEDGNTTINSYDARVHFWLWQSESRIHWSIINERRHTHIWPKCDGNSRGKSCFIISKWHHFLLWNTYNILCSVNQLCDMHYKFFSTVHILYFIQRGECP